MFSAQGVRQLRIIFYPKWVENFIHYFVIPEDPGFNHAGASLIGNMVLKPDPSPECLNVRVRAQTGIITV